MKIGLGPYFLKKAVINIMKNRLVHLIGMGTMVTSLLIFGAFLLLFVNLNDWIKGWGDSVSMSIYLHDDIDGTSRDEIGAFVKTLPSAEITGFISKEQAMGEFRKALGSQAGLLEALSSNPLPASLEVRFHNMEGNEPDIKKVKNRLEAIKGVEEVQYSEEWVRRFESLVRLVKIISYIIGGLLSVGVLFIVTNTIKLTIYARREEIEILKLVGATDWFVRIPFLLEGAIQGVLSGVLAILILFSGYALLSTQKTTLLGLAVLDFRFLPQQYLLSIFLISILLGVLGSFIAVGRFFEYR